MGVIAYNIPPNQMKFHLRHLDGRDVIILIFKSKR